MFYRTEVIADRSSTLRKYEFSTCLIGSCDLDLDPMTLIYELDAYPLEMYRMCENERPTSTLSKFIVRQTDRHTVHTYRQTRPRFYTTPLRGCGITKPPAWVITASSVTPYSTASAAPAVGLHLFSWIMDHENSLTALEASHAAVDSADAVKTQTPKPLARRTSYCTTYIIEVESYTFVSGGRYRHRCD